MTIVVLLLVSRVLTGIYCALVSLQSIVPDYVKKTRNMFL